MFEELCCTHGISTATYYNWKDKYAGMTLTYIKRLKQMKDESHNLKQMVANQSIEILLKKSFKHIGNKCYARC